MCFWFVLRRACLLVSYRPLAHVGFYRQARPGLGASRSSIIIIIEVIKFTTI